MRKRGVLALLLAVVIIVSAGCDLLGAKEQVFSKEGLTLTLTSRFKEADYEDYTVSYESPTVLVLALREAKSDFINDQMNLDEYGELLIEANDLDSSLEHRDGLTCLTYTYTDDSSDETFTYFTAIYEGDEDFWVVQFVSTEAMYKNLESDFVTYAQSVKV